METLLKLWQSTGISHMDSGQLIMIGICLLLLFLAVRKGFEPLLLVPIGFGGLLANIPGAGMALSAIEQALQNGTPEIGLALAQLAGLTGTDSDALIYKTLLAADPNIYQTALHLVQAAGYSDGMLYTFYKTAIASGAAPLLIFIGVGAMTDFGPLLANPKTLLLGAAAQFGIFTTVLGAIGLSYFGLDFTIAEAAAIGIIGGADGPTAIYVTNKLAPDLLGAIAVAAYSYMALVPLIQPPIMRALTTKAERGIVMKQMRSVGKREKIIFPIVMLILVGLFLPDAAPLIGSFCFGNLMRECGVVDRLSDTAQNALINTTTIFLGLSVGSKLAADKFLDPKTLGILALGIVAFGIGTAAGVLMAKLMNMFSKEKVNPLIGSAGVSAVPMAARVSNKLGLQANPQNYLLMHAMGPNVAGVIGSAIAAGVMISIISSLP
ncbi:MAG: sodium ion-translocating decarboxylase subunit beta [Cellvibrio sp.]|nr:sodium ion-translocating decarboxylase subunit beta [Cellvibrio sp.]